MPKTTMVHARIEPDLKKDVQDVLHAVGLSTSEAITLYFKQIAMHRGIPFEVKVPNAKTLAAMQEVAEGKTQAYDSLDDAIADLRA